MLGFIHKGRASVREEVLKIKTRSDIHMLPGDVFRMLTQ